ncbi:MAG: hypothetical protein ABJK37_14280 [Paraglaciecola sp.]|uniref:YkvI family membrane protein n=1 Tax=Paraglaciecola sp. TaxID=1920173 RepID=UPI0032975FDC
MGNILRTYLLPGLIFQGVIIGGGYATGRELVEFFLSSGPLGGILGMALSALIWGVVMAVSFELCRLTRSYDYRNFFILLLGRYWFLYELLFVLTLTVSLAVIGSASGEIISTSTGWPQITGTFILLIVIGFLVFYGNTAIERFMGFWSFVLYVTYLGLVIWCLINYFDVITLHLDQSELDTSWIWNGIKYAGYNVAAVPAVFFSLRHIQNRQQAISAGLIGGFVAIIPAFLLFTALLVGYPSILDSDVPSTALLEQLELPWFNYVFQLVLIGTFIQTGVGLVHTVNERISVTMSETKKTLPNYLRPLFALLFLSTAMILADTFGIVTLIAKGFGVLTYGFILVFVVPTLTIGIRYILKNNTP